MQAWLNDNAGVVLAILTHGAASIWFASKMNTTVTIGFKNLNDTVTRMDREMEKRDKDSKDVSTAMWKRIDEVRDRVTHLEAKS